ncbi:MAG: glycoside hydrolase family 2 TIM barrel-domain containing protein [Caldilineaceae bacterium]
MTQLFRPEHPRPNFQRSQWINLNGPWRFAFDPGLIGEQEHWYLAGKLAVRPYMGRLRREEFPLTINVPFPWESPASGVCRPDYKGAGWYEREFTIPAEWQEFSPFLHFGAVDWHARVWINGRLVAENDHGYLPFSIDLSQHVKPGESATVTVRAYDIAEASTLVGKQVPRWYTHSSGIWQTVWLEARPANHITAIRIEPNVAKQEATVKLRVQVAKSGSYTVRIRSQDNAFSTLEVQRDLRAGEQPIQLTLPVPAPQLWSPESPYLYDIYVELEGNGTQDQVATYFGMRTVERGAWNGNQYEYILLNGEPVYLRGALDQSFHPATLHSFPSDDVIRGDIQLAKDLGLNMLRCHIKINDPRYYYWADRLGLLIMYDFPSPDLDTPAMRHLFEQTIPQVLARDFNSPSIFAWVIFNETWGLTNHDIADSHRWLRRMYKLTQKLDPTRLVEDNSPCHYNHVESDINSWHFYINDYHRVRQHVQRVVDDTYPGSSFNYVGKNDAGDNFVQTTAPLMNSEFGGIAARSGDQDVAWCFKYQTTEQRRHAKICGYIYTELDDIEWEHNGFVNYDRSQKEFGYDFFVEGMTVADLNVADFVGLDAPPCQTLTSGSSFSAPLFVSHWGTPLGKAQVRWQLDFTDRFGKKQRLNEGTIATSPTRFSVTDLGLLELPLPSESGLATIGLLLEDEQGNIRSRNYVNVAVQVALPAVEKLQDGWALRFAPGNYSQVSANWPQPFTAPDGSKFGAGGSGWVEYAVVLPAEVDLTVVNQLRLLVELGARTAGARIDWPTRTYGFNYPQTETDRKIPSDVVVSINDIVIGTVHLPDDPADARGVLSHHANIEPGSYGFLTELTVDSATLKQLVSGTRTLHIRFAVPVDAAVRGGVSIYGETVGCWPVGPTVILSTQ